MRVLVVDDNPDIRMLVAIQLGRAGWRVDQAASGEEALELVAAPQEYDLLVLDQSMPGLSGLQVAEQLRRDGAQVPILLFSAYLDEAVEKAAAELGVPTLDKEHLPRLASVASEFTGG